MYGVLLNAVFQDIETADQFGKLALSLANRFNSKANDTKTFFVLGAFIIHWKAHLRETLPLLLKSYQTALETGNPEFVGYATKDICQYSYFLGHELPLLEPKMQAYTEVLANLQQSATLTTCQIFWQVALNLLGKSDNPWILTGKATDEATLLPALLDSNNMTWLHSFYLHKLILCYLFRQIDQATELAEKSIQYLSSAAGYITVPIFYFYDALTALAVCRDRPSEQEALLQRVAANQTKLEKWAHHAPTNYLHKYFLVEAERQKVLGEPMEAMALYDRAIALAQEQEFLNEAALAYELAAQFYLDWGKNIIAQAYLVNAYQMYDRWGAQAKLKDLEQRYAPLLKPIFAPVLSSRPVNSIALLPSAIASMSGSQTTHSTSISSISEALDFTTVLKASQALSGEIQLDKLLSTLMQVMLENAGAQTGTLMLCQGNDLVIQAQASRGQNEGDQPLNIRVLQAIPVQNCEEIPLSVINYVSRTLKTFVIDDATTDNTFANDPYIFEHQLKSILCTPIRKQGKLIGVLYLENNLTRGAFTRDRLQVLKLLTAQAATSLDNALLYENLTVANQQLEEYNTTLEQRVTERTADLNQKTQHLQQTLQQLQQTQAQLIQVEKMSSLGQLVAGIAHEINNPVNFIHGNLKPTREYIKSLVELISLYQQEHPQPTPAIAAMIEDIDLEFMLEDLAKLLRSMQAGSDRIRTIVSGLRNFSRLDEADIKFVDLHDGIESTLMILQHRLKRKSNSTKIEIIKDYSNLPKVGCYAGQLNQVLMNILSNAIDAVEQRKESGDQEYQPQIGIRTELGDPGWLRIRISDNGCGMPETVRQKIFDPFFTTKPVGSGTGLGLSISYQIVMEKHQGRLLCESTPDQGTEFIVEIPLQN
jgi:signal transduction histidine kinase/tetratricopeptide (TPR) repeat protein